MQKEAFIAKVKTGNPSFDRAFKRMAQAQFECVMYNLLFWTPTIRPSVAEYPAIYQKLNSEIHFTTTEVLKYPFGQQFMDIYLTYKKMLNKNEGAKLDPDFKMKNCVENIKNDTLRGLYLLEQLLQASKYDQFYRARSEKYKPFILTDEQKTKLQDFELSLKKLAPGEPAINFEGTTVEGKKIALTDFKGKVILVDIWATWCGPCKGEIPSLQKLEEEMKGKENTFISLASFDQHDTWAKFVIDQKLGGIQLIADATTESIISKDYKIAGIPRFMVFDKQGKIVDHRRSTSFKSQA